MRPWITAAVLATVVLALFAWEVYALLNDKPGDTISEVMAAAKENPMVPLIIGMLIGHFFWPMYR